ncbi:hypothetical protein ACFXA3_05805 [Streptomyces sp. NPDC059456]|uniref:hypothetical protein n=1 Tax=Streptomyces sp. NPDC059456 TaxID=3346838 RepID=UPI00367B0867
MHSTLVRRTVLTASAVSLALLATACGSGQADDKKADAGPSAAASSAAPAAKGKTDAELAGLLVARADLPEHVFKAPGADEAAAAGAATSDKADCLPLVKAQSGAPVGASTGVARTKVTAKPKGASATAAPEDKLKAGLEALSGTVTQVTLASYDGKGAEEAFTALKTAGTACAGGYGVTSGPDKVKISKVGAGAPVTAGDAALAYVVEAEADGEKTTSQLVVVRRGNTLASFYGLSLAGTAEQPKPVVDAQVKKLG